MQVCCKTHRHSYFSINLPVQWHWGQPECQVPGPLVLRCYIILQVVDTVRLSFMHHHLYVAHTSRISGFGAEMSGNVWQTYTGLVSWEILRQQITQFVHTL